MHIVIQLPVGAYHKQQQCSGQLKFPRMTDVRNVVKPHTHDLSVLLLDKF